MSPIPVRTPMTARDLVRALALPARIVGDEARRIDCIVPLEAIAPGALTFSKRPVEALAAGDAAEIQAVVIAPNDAAPFRQGGLTLILVADPRAYFIRAVRHLAGPGPQPAPGRAAGVVVAPDARVEAETYLGPGVVVGPQAVIGRGCVLHGGAQVYDGVSLGEGTIVQANAVIGCHGQAYVREDDGTILDLPHFGRVLVGARARIGANTTIVRGTLRDTEIGADTSVGNNVNIGHNVRVGARCFIGVGTMLAGSSSVGDDSWISPGVVVRGVAIGRGVTVGVGAVVTRSIPDGKTANGFPARVTAAEQ